MWGCVFSVYHFPCDDWENIYNLFYYHHHQIGSMNYYPLLRVRSWQNGMRCVSMFFNLILWSIHQVPVSYEYGMSTSSILCQQMSRHLTVHGHPSTEPVLTAKLPPPKFTWQSRILCKCFELNGIMQITHCDLTKSGGSSRINDHGLKINQSIIRITWMARCLCVKP